MTLYHASPVVVDSPDTLHSRLNLDFGQGFYLTRLREQAIKYGLRFAMRETAYLNTYELDPLPGTCRVRRFAAYDGEWLDYVAKCRKGWHDAEADMVEGGVANDKVFNTIDLYFSGLINRDEALGRLRYEHPNHQICILRQDTIDRYLHFTGATKITL